MFSLLPLRSYKQAHMPLTQTTLPSVYKGLTHAKMLKPKFKNCVYMTTDGVRCHMGAGPEADGEEEEEEEEKTTHRRKRAQEETKSLYDSDKGFFRECDLAVEVERRGDVNVVGIDPGRTTLMQASHKYKLSKGRYYNECGFQAVEQRRNAYLAALPPEIQASRVAAEALSFKLWNGTQFLANWETMRPHRVAMFQIYGHRSLANDTFWSYTRKQQCLDRMAKDLFADDKTVLAFGNGQFPTSYKGARSGPGVSLAKYLSKRGRVVMTDEFRTSMMCSECHHPQKNMPIQTRVPVKEEKENHDPGADGGPERATWKRRRKRKAIPGLFKEVERERHAVLKCQHCSERQGRPVFRNRDKNAARNMRDILVAVLCGKGRPMAFCRAACHPLQLLA